jgi:hypothetical protein
MSLTLRTIVFFVPELEAAIQHYRLTFGSEPTVQRPGWAEFHKDGFTIALHRGKGRAARFEYTTTDLDGLHAQWLEAGLKPSDINDARGVRAFQGKGPDGNSFLIKEILQ